MSKQSSLSSSIARSSTSRKIRKFSFTNLSLSYLVRKRLYEMLISFDDNVNYQFQKEEIKKALIEILDQTESQVAYVLNNVFRYDTNHDGVVTYQQFSNFCLQQHFGEMAIQRLHKTGLYVRGKERFMAGKQFHKTLEYCLSFISIKPDENVVNTIVNDIDLDRDGYISYSDYFTFLKEYFGSQSQSASMVTVKVVEEDLKKAYGNVDRKIMKEDIFREKIRKHEQQRRLKALEDEKRRQAQQQQRRLKKLQQDKRLKALQQQNQLKALQQQNRLKMLEQKNRQKALEQQNRLKSIQQLKPKSLFPSSVLSTPTPQLLDLANRIARLIYQQLKIVTLEHDHSMLLYSNQANAIEILQNVIKVSQKRAQNIVNQAFLGKSTTTYENFIKFAIEKYMSEDIGENLKDSVNKDGFLREFFGGLIFIRVKPFGFLVQELFEKYANGKQEINRQEFKNLMSIIYSAYKWPRVTGEPRHRSSMLAVSESHKILRF